MIGDSQLTPTGAGAAYGTAKSGIGIAGVGSFRPDLIMKASNVVSRTCASNLLTRILQSLIPVVMSGIIAVYGLVIAVLIAGACQPEANTSLYA